MTDRLWPWHDSTLSQRGYLSLGPDGQLRIEIEDGFVQGSDALCGLGVKESVELAEAIIRRAKATHRIVEREAIGDVYERLRDIMEEEE